MQFKSGEWVTDPVVEQSQPIVTPERRLAAVIPFIEKEMAMVGTMLAKSFALSGQIQRNCFLVPFRGLDIKSLLITTNQAFSSVGVISDAEGKVSDWQEGRLMRDAAGPNSLFRQASWFFYLNKRYPAWLWLEPDCTPITWDWFYQLETEYFNVGRPFMGVKMRMPDGTEYMNGVGIYPWNAVQYAPLLVQATMWKQFPDIEAGFDVAGGKDVLSKAHLTRKIQLEIGNKNEVTVRPETVIVHGRNNLSGVSERSATSGTDAGGSNPQRSSGPSTDDVTVSGEPTPSQTNLGAIGVAGEPQTSVLDETTCSPHRLSEHETRPHQIQGGDAECVQTVGQIQQETSIPMTRSSAAPTFDPNGAASETKQASTGYGAISKDIKFYVSELVRLWDEQPHRKVKIVEELRRVKLVPKHFR